jgi:hypothetical protein
MTPTPLTTEIEECLDTPCMGDGSPETSELLHPIKKTYLCQTCFIKNVEALIQKERRLAVEEAIRKLEDLSNAQLFLGGTVEYEGYMRAINDLKHIDEPYAFI